MRSVTRSLIGLGLLSLLLISSAHAATINVTADITVSETWTADNEYILTQVIYVTNGATLTIEPGTVIRGEPESSPGANDPGTLVVTRGSKIRALGNIYHPVVFTDLLDDNVGDSGGSPPYDSLFNALGLTGQWGGVILLGYGYVSNDTLAGPNASREVQIEGLTAASGLGLYGNCASSPLTPPAECDDDDSGVLNYVSIRYGGFNLSANNEINGLTLGAVGRQTEIDYLEVIQNKDDGIEFFGGAAQIKHAIIAAVGDDGVDYDEGWRGKMQFVLQMQGTPGADKSDKGGEHDGGNNPDGSQPFAIPTIYNATYIGHGGNGVSTATVNDPSKAYTNKAQNTTLHMRDNAGGRYYNSFFGSWGGAALLVEGTTIETNTSGERSVTPYAFDTWQQGPASTFQLELQDNTAWCYGAQVAATPMVPTAAADANTAGGSNRDHTDPGIFTNAALDNAELTCNDPSPIRQLQRTSNPDPTVPDPVTMIDPRPTVGSPLLTTNRDAPLDGFFESAPYRGAFGPGGNANWAYKWSTTYRLGYFPPKPQVSVSADITTSTTWTADNEYVLENVIYVANGATLTVEEGTVVRGEPESSPGANDPGALVIARGSKIKAVGSSYNPVVFTNLDDDNVGAGSGTAPYDDLANAIGVTGTWGGVILLGYGYVSNDTLAGPNAAREVQIEGLTAVSGLGLYGNCASSPLVPPSECDDDDSGMMDYVSIRYGGFNLSANNEINGLTLGAVGRQTMLEHIEVFQNKDDGIEFFGGAAQIKHAVIVAPGDDGVDYDEGWRGKMQFVFLMQSTPGADKSDKGGEHDGGNNPDGSQPFAIPTIYNATYIGHGGNGASGPTVNDPAKSYTNKAQNTTLHIRDNAGGRYYNSFFGSWGGAAFLIEGDLGEVNTSGERAVTPYAFDTWQQGPASAFQLELEDNTVWCYGAQGAGTPMVPTAAAAANTAGGSNRIHADPGIFTNAALDNTELTCNDPLPIRRLERTAVPISTVPDIVTSIDPRPASGSPLLITDRTAPADGFFTPVTHRGAFTSNWAAGYWTAMTRLGYFPECDTVLTPNAIPDEVATLEYDGSVWTWTYLGFNNRSYDFLRSNDASDFTGATFVESADYDTEAECTVLPSPGQGFYYLVQGRNDCGTGSLGYESDGTERVAP